MLQIDKDSIEYLKHDLLVVNWDNVMNKTDVDKLYNKFIYVFTNLYDKKCPLKEINVCKGSKGNIEHKPWCTNGLRNACNKKIICTKTFFTVE